jgi:hypothetical protein
MEILQGKSSINGITPPFFIMMFLLVLLNYAEKGGGLMRGAQAVQETNQRLEQYADILRAYLGEQNEEALYRAYLFGRDLGVMTLQLLSLMEIHHAAVRRLLEESEGQCRDVVRCSVDVCNELLTGWTFVVVARGDRRK